MFVIELAGLQAVVKLADELVEQVPLGLVVPVSGGAAGIEVAAGARGGAQRSQCPDRAHSGQAPVLDMPVQHNGFLATGAGDRGRAGEGFEPAGIGEAGAVITDLGQHPGTGQVPQPGEAGDDLGVRVLLKMGDRRLGQLVGSGAGGAIDTTTGDGPVLKVDPAALELRGASTLPPPNSSGRLAWTVVWSVAVLLVVAGGVLLRRRHVARAGGSARP